MLCKTGLLIHNITFVLGVFWVSAVCHRFARQSRMKTGALRLQNSAPLKLLFPGFLKLQKLVNHALSGHHAE